VRRGLVKRLQPVAGVILGTDALGGRAGYRRYVADYLAERPPRGPARAAINQRPWLVIVVLAVCTAMAALALTSLHTPAPGQKLPVVLAACCLIVALRRWPSPMLAVTAAAVAMVMANGTASLPFGIMLGVAVFLTASKLPRRISIRAAVTVGLVLGAGLLYSAFANTHSALVLETVAGYAPLVAGWFVGDSVAARRRYLAGLAEQAERERAAEAERDRQEIREERVRIAHELHDVVAHTLAVITVQAGVGRRLMDKRPEEASAALESIETIGRTAQDELRVVLGLLRHEEAAIALAPAPKLVDLKELADNVRSSGTPVELRTSGADRPLSPALELSIYRVVQEALTNVVKHAPGARTSVDLNVSEGLVRLEVADDGGPARRAQGSQDVPADPGTGHGIVGMRERVGAFGGWLVAEPGPGRGFRVQAEIPVEASV
jgi:signal transduction histidine kinase